MDYLSSISQGALAFGLLVFVLLAIVLPISAYTGQKHAYHCLLERRKLNAVIQALRATVPPERSAPK